jgi:glucose/arabinose dehydrogenase
MLQVYALIDADGDGVAEEVKVLTDSLVVPHGLAWHAGTLYVAEPGIVYRVADVDRKVLAGELPVPCPAPCQMPILARLDVLS